MTNVEDFKPGDLVEITNAPPTMKKWIGFPSRVAAEWKQHALDRGDIFIDPITPRPDGHGLTSFFWKAEHLKRVVPVEEKTNVGISNAEIRKIVTDHLGGLDYGEQRLIQALQQANGYDIDAEADSAVAEFVDKKIQAIKRVRENTGAGLKESKQAVERAIVRYYESKLTDARNVVSNHYTGDF